MGTFKRNGFTGIVNSYIPCKNYHFVTVSCKNLAIMSKIYWFYNSQHQDYPWEWK